ncbi:hypothetical protein BJ138DRAFT_995548 [Hygrophoropsis aurantiaca]|uniref:Uncharacterized protein n=1 Tax=Hygrophoropsis aurantiaca TaxID=72124 RepID=A0ACB8ATB0_9AGAM|nr:hypothetical protein BJ138DRAFT_995548 [Hygrophoropsis aurantiaca]
MMFSLYLLFVLLALTNIALGYIPAVGTNDTSSVGQPGSNITDSSKLHLQWFSNGSDWEYISYQLVGANSNGISQGALVHFSEDYSGNATTSTPWIALVSCDANSTNASQEDDIFTLARDRGAQSALLYSLKSEACLINPAYADPASFDQVFDIFSTQSSSVSRAIEHQFGQFGPGNESYYGYFNATRLNSAGTTINNTIQTNNPVAPGFIYATLQAYNATAPNANGSQSNNNSSGSTTSSDGNRKETGLAMIILYAITGCVSALFCVVIISGAIRAIRHPERYGPRMADGGHGGHGDGGQSRARGLGRAMLDTFPVVKFGASSDDRDDSIGNRQYKDVETPPVGKSTTDPLNQGMEMDDMVAGREQRPHGNEMEQISTSTPEALSETNAYEGEDPVAGGSRNVVPRLNSPPNDNSRIANPVVSPTHGDGPIPDSIGRETCPICIVDFEEGDDLRVLPCEGKHRFHQQCVDPWLLELSGSCPICRQDFHALEEMLSDGYVDEDIRSSQRYSQAPQQNRFSRYIRFARRRHDRRGWEGPHGHDPTDPYRAVIPESVV